MTGTPAGPAAPANVKRLFSRKGRFDSQPTQEATVLLASHGAPFSPAAIEEAVRLSAGGPVAVLSIARVYGSAFGMPNPGLLPTGKELAVQQDQVRDAIAAVERHGQIGWGQVAATRRPARTIARAARARRVDHVVVCEPPAPRWRRVVEGDPVKPIQRRLGAAVSVSQVS